MIDFLSTPEEQAETAHNELIKSFGGWAGMVALKLAVASAAKRAECDPCEIMNGLINGWKTEVLTRFVSVVEDEEHSDRLNTLVNSVVEEIQPVMLKDLNTL